MATVTGETRQAFITAELDKRSFGKRTVNEAIKHVANETGGKLSSEHDDDEDLGSSVLLKHPDAQVQLSVKELKDRVHLMNIQTKDPSDLKRQAKGTGRGTEVINALKSYSDKTGKPLHILDATENATKYWDKDSSLKRAQVETTLEGKKYTPNVSYTYTPKPKGVVNG
jgi:hypothetical protein